MRLIAVQVLCLSFVLVSGCVSSQHHRDRGAGALNIYYDPSLAGNSYLILFGSGLLGLVGIGRRRREVR